MYGRYFSTVICLLAVFFLSCTNVSFSDCKSNMWLFFSLKNLEYIHTHTRIFKKSKAKEINVANASPGDARLLLFIVSCPVSCVRLLCPFSQCLAAFSRTSPRWTYTPNMWEGGCCGVLGEGWWNLGVLFHLRFPADLHLLIFTKVTY